MNQSSTDGVDCYLEERYGSCWGPPDYEHEGNRCCVLHFPSEDKKVAFRTALEAKLKREDFNFGGAFFPSDTAHFEGATFSEWAYFGGATFSGETSFGGATFVNSALTRLWVRIFQTRGRLRGRRGRITIASPFSKGRGPGSGGALPIRCGRHCALYLSPLGPLHAVLRIMHHNTYLAIRLFSEVQ